MACCPRKKLTPENRGWPARLAAARFAGHLHFLLAIVGGERRWM